MSGSTSSNETNPNQTMSGNTNETKEDPPSQPKLDIAQVDIDEEYKLRRLFYGKKTKVIMDFCTIMLIGRIGSGKRTMVNALINYILGIKVYGYYRWQLDKDSTSVPLWLTCYTIYPGSESKIKYIFNIIDTPGLGDTPCDISMVKQMQKLLTSEERFGINKGINFICYVANLQVANFITDEKCCIEKWRRLLGKDTVDHLYVFGSHTEDTTNNNSLNFFQEYSFKLDPKYYFDNRWLHKGDDVVKSQFYQNRFEEACDKLFFSMPQPCGLHETRSVLATHLSIHEHKLCLYTLLAESNVRTLCESKMQGELIELSIGKTITTTEIELIASTTNNVCCTECKKVCFPKITSSPCDRWRVTERGNCTKCSHGNTRHITGAFEYKSKEKTIMVTNERIIEVVSELQRGWNNDEEEIAKQVIFLKQCMDKLPTIALGTETQSEYCIFETLIENEQNNDSETSKLRIKNLKRLQESTKKIVLQSKLSPQ